MRVLCPSEEWTVIQSTVPVCLFSSCCGFQKRRFGCRRPVTRFTTSCQQRNTCQDRSRCQARNGSIKPTDHCYISVIEPRQQSPILHPDDRAWFNSHRRGTIPRVQRSKQTECDAMYPDQANRGQDN